MPMFSLRGRLTINRIRCAVGLGSMGVLRSGREMLGNGMGGGMGFRGLGCRWGRGRGRRRRKILL